MGGCQCRNLQTGEWLEKWIGGCGGEGGGKRGRRKDEVMQE